MSHYSRRLLRVLLLAVFSTLLLTLVRFEDLCWNWSQFKGQDTNRLFLAFLVGLRFDLTAAAWTNAPLLLISLFPWPERFEKLWGRVAAGLFVLIQIPLLLLNMIDVEFVNFVGRRMTRDVLFLLNEGFGKTGGFIEAYTPLFVVAAGGTLFALWGARKILRWQPQRPSWIPSGRLARSVFAFLLLLVFVVASRGGFQKKPIHFVDANVFPLPALNNLVLNTSFVLIKNWDQENLPRQKFFDDPKEMLSHLNAADPQPSLLEGRRKTTKQNVVILILESFGLEYLGKRHGGKSYSPFLDSLVEKSLFFKNGFANGRRSIEGIPAVLSGIPAMMNEPFVTSPFAGTKVSGLGTLLQDHHYQTAFFHGGRNGTMHFDAFTKSAGFDLYFGAGEYPNKNDDDGVWGIYDGPFLNWTREQIANFEPPFAVAFFSLSSHQPYLIPSNVKDRFPDGPLPILKTIAYVDDSLKEFFATAQNEAWFKDTLFVITADHTFKAYQEAFDNELSRFRVPVIFYHPDFQWPESLDREQIVQQIDLLPSILDFLNVPSPEKNWLARSVFQPGRRTATAFVDGNYYEVSKEGFLHWPRQGEPKFYGIEDAAQKNPRPVTDGGDLFLRLKAAIQYFSEGLWENRLVRP